MLFDYDFKDAESIIQYAKELEGKSFADILSMYEKSTYKTYNDFQQHKKQIHEDTIYSQKDDYKATPVFAEQTVSYTTNRKAKGRLGGFIEERYFGYKPNSKSEADFADANLELKLTPVDIIEKKKEDQIDYRAGERLSITNISFSSPVEDDFMNTHLWNKLKRILLIHYIRDKSKSQMEYIIKYVTDFRIPYNDLLIIIQDYNSIIQKIKNGKAHELSESDTLYLGACTKGATAEKSWVSQYYNPNVLAKKRNFCLKQSYMNVVLHKYVMHTEEYESILRAESNLRTSFDDYVLSLLSKYYGKTDKELCSLFNIEYDKPNKNKWAILAYQILGIKNNKAEEFEKAGITVRAIRLEKNGKNKESMSLDTFDFMDLVSQNWEDSDLYNYFDSTRFLFVVYTKFGDCYKLTQAKFWHMPYEDLNITVKKEWELVKETIINGVEFKKTTRGIENNLLKKSESEIIHLRPKADNAAYKLHDGTFIGNIERDANILPNGEYMTTQCFWINNDYILKQL